MPSTKQITTERFGLDWFKRARGYSDVVGADFYAETTKYKMTTSVRRGVIDTSRNRWATVMPTPLKGQRNWLMFFTVYGHGSDVQSQRLQALISAVQNLSVLSGQTMAQAWMTSSHYPGGFLNIGRLAPLANIQVPLWFPEFTYPIDGYYNAYDALEDPSSWLNRNDGMGIRVATGGQPTTLAPLAALADVEFDIAANIFGRTPKVNIMNVVIGEAGGNAPGAGGSIDTVLRKFSDLSTMGVRRKAQRGQTERPERPLLGAMINYAVCTSGNKDVRKTFNASHAKMGFNVLPEWDVQSIVDSMRTDSERAEQDQASRTIHTAGDLDAD